MHRPTCNGAQMIAAADNLWTPPPTFVDRRAAAAADNLSALRRYRCCCVVILGIFDDYFFKFSALWQVKTSNGFMFLDVELLSVCSSSSPVIFFLVFSFLIYNPFFLLLFLFEVSSLSLYVPSSSVGWFLLSLTGIFLLLPVLTPHLICALSN